MRNRSPRSPLSSNNGAMRDLSMAGRDFHPSFLVARGLVGTFSFLFRQARRSQAHADYLANARAIREGEAALKLREGRIGTIADAQALNMAVSHEAFSGSYMGCLNGVPLINNSDKHEMIVGLAGSGKSTTVAIPKIIGMGMGTNPESVVCIDIKGELWGATSAGRTILDGVEPIIINPWGMYGLPSTRLNLFEDLKVMAAAGRPIKDAVLAKVAMIHPSPDSKGANAWIAAAALRVSACILGHLAECEPERACPAVMADISTFSQSDFAELLLGLKSSPACGGWVADIASKLLDQYGEADDPKYFEWVMEEYASAWEMFGKGSVLREETLETDFNFAQLKQKARAVYIMIPPRYLISHGKYVALLLDTLIDIIAAARGPVRVSFICDEFVNIPKAKSTVQALRLYRSEGIRMVVFAQDREGFSKYKDEGGYKPFEENSIGLYWGIRDGAHMRDIEARAGYKYSLVSGVNAAIGERVNSGGHNASLQRLPVLPVDEIAQIADGRAILEIPGQRLFIVERPFWKDLPFCAGLIRDLRADPLPEIDHL